MLEDAVVKLVAVLKTNTAFGSPPPSSVSVPVISAVPVSYAPGPIVRPPSSTGPMAADGNAASSSTAAPTAACACTANRWPSRIDPDTCAGRSPVMAPAVEPT
jgi:hypothetical protein